MKERLEQHYETHCSILELIGYLQHQLLPSFCIIGHFNIVNFDQVIKRCTNIYVVKLGSLNPLSYIIILYLICIFIDGNINFKSST